MNNSEVSIYSAACQGETYTWKTIMIILWWVSLQGYHWNSLIENLNIIPRSLLTLQEAIIPFWNIALVFFSSDKFLSKHRYLFLPLFLADCRGPCQSVMSDVIETETGLISDFVASCHWKDLIVIVFSHLHCADETRFFVMMIVSIWWILICSCAIWGSFRSVIVFLLASCKVITI